MNLDQASEDDRLESQVQHIGSQMFDLVEGAPEPSTFSRKGFYRALMDWAMGDPHFKTQFFRFIDVLPSLKTSAEVSRHLQEYLGEDKVTLSPGLRLGLSAAGGAGWLFGAGVKAQVTSMARQFMLGDDPREIVTTLKKLNDDDISFTVDILGEASVSEKEADDYARRYQELITSLTGEVRKWKHSCRSNESSRGPMPTLNVSVKLSALYSQIHPADPTTAIERISGRLRPILRQARDVGAFINFDMESYALKDLTLQLFRTIFCEDEFSKGPAFGLALQAYLRDSEKDLHELIQWGSEHRKSFTVRLVKGAYWDYETIIAGQRGWPVPVFARKMDTDGNFERLAGMILKNPRIIHGAFATHNVRSIAFILACAEAQGLARRDFEFQMLYGMADPIKHAVLKLGCRLREYCPVGELLPGMAYLVRRLLENTSNDGFLAQKFGKGVDRLQLLARPGSNLPAPPLTMGTEFRNEPPTDFTIARERQEMTTALEEVRAMLGRKYQLIIQNKAVEGGKSMASLNPCRQGEVIGYAAQATIAQANEALAIARKSQPGWARLPASVRAAFFRRVAALLRRDRKVLCAWEILEAGKNWTEADGDVAEAIDFCEFYSNCIEDRSALRLTQRVPGETNLQHWIPRGVGVVIAPWNFPLAILTGMTAAAAVAGNTVILKPSDQTPVIAARLMALLIEAGLLPGVVQLLSGTGSPLGSHLVAHPLVDFVAFTGSREVGLKIWETAGRTAAGQRNLKKVVCEMGGKNCVIIDSDADLDEAVAGSIASAFSYQGQKCSALSRLIVLKDNYDRFIGRLVDAAAALRAGSPEEPGAIIGPVISKAAQKRILDIIESEKALNPILWQGNVPQDENACYVPPTIFHQVKRSSRLFREEIFGPVLSLTKAEDLDEALALANDCEFALTGGCYSRNPATLERVREEMVCGNLYLNRPITGALVARQPFGGFLMSGGGTKAGGAEYLQNFLIPRVITENCLRRGFAPMEAGE